LAARLDLDLQTVTLLAGLLQSAIDLRLIVAERLHCLPHFLGRFSPMVLEPPPVHAFFHPCRQGQRRLDIVQDIALKTPDSHLKFGRSCGFGHKHGRSQQKKEKSRAAEREKTHMCI